MWSREILKQNAKTALSGRYMTAFAACLIVSAISRIFSFAMGDGPSVKGLTTGRAVLETMRWSGIGSLSLLFDIFVITVLTVGLSRFFLQNHFGVTDISTVFSGFKRNYGSTVGGMFVTYLFIFL